MTSIFVQQIRVSLSDGGFGVGRSRLVFFFNEFISCFFFYLLAVLGLCCRVQAFSSFGEQGLLSGCGVTSSHCGCFSCCGAQALRARGLSSRDTGA